MRVKTAAALIGLALAAAAMNGCAADASGSAVSITPDGGDAQSVAVGDVTCLTMSGKFAATSKDMIGELPQFIASHTDKTDKSVTWVNLGGDDWFMTTEAFTNKDGAVRFDDAAGHIGTGQDGDYPIDLHKTGTIDGTVSCTDQKEL